jgi:hypothetical protein
MPWLNDHGFSHRVIGLGPRSLYPHRAVAQAHVTIVSQNLSTKNGL